MSNILYWILAVLLLGILIIVHELGHFGAARLCGLRVMSFGIGFGPKIFSRTGKDGTKYVIRALPLGGYCRFYGEDEQVDGEDKQRPIMGGKELTEADALYNQPIWKRAFMTVSGPLMNFALALVVIFLVYTVVGLPTVDTLIDQVDPGTPAAEAGLLPGDRFVEVNGIEVIDVTTVQDQIALNPGAPVDVVVQRENERVSVQVTPQYDEAQGRALIGIFFGRTNLKISVWQAIPYSFQSVGNMTVQIFDFLRKLITRGEGVNDMAGPIGAIAVVKEETQNYGLFAYLSMMASISVNLGLFNILPIPGLDGSRLLFMAIEAIRRKRIDPNKEGLVHLIGVGVLLLLMLPIYVRDIINLFR